METAQPNGPRASKTTGRLRHTLTNTASKQDAGNAQRPGKASYGRHTRPTEKTTKFQSDQKLAKLAQKVAPATAPKVQAPTPVKSNVQSIVTGGLLGALAALRNGGPVKLPNYGGTAGAPQQNIQLAKSIAKEYGWTQGQWRALKALGMRESGWRTDAANPTSSARGIAQAMMSVHFGKDWENSPEAQKYLTDPETQIRWMASYIQGRYKDPVSALRFHIANNYY